jgi:4-hydroxy-3-methylbut-2-enyl diphosphate reductase
VQRRVREAVVARDGNADSFRVFDTICGATQERQDALGELLRQPPDLMLVVGGYNSSNTTHLADMAAEKTPSYFVVNASCLESPAKIRHFDTHRKEEIASADWMPSGPVILGITAGASCPGNLIEDVLRRFLELRGIALEEPSA